MTEQTQPEAAQGAAPQSEREYSGFGEKEGKRLGISRTNPIPRHINVVADTPQSEGAAPRAEGPDPTEYERGFEGGRRAAERDAMLVVAAMVEQAGGEIRLARKHLVATDGGLTVHDDPATMERVYRLRSRPSDDPEEGQG